MSPELTFKNHAFTAMFLAAGMLPANGAILSLYELDRLAKIIAPQHALDSRLNVNDN